jgi:quinol monooxygenase YgiN
MYGTIARFRVKPGKTEELMALDQQYKEMSPPGLVAQYVYRMDADPDTYYLVVAFDSKESYVANANSPEQDTRYRQFAELLEGEPEWHDGEIVSSS